MTKFDKIMRYGIVNFCVDPPYDDGGAMALATFEGPDSPQRWLIHPRGFLNP